MKFLCNKSALSSLLAVFFIQGCAQSGSFSPPMNGENIHFIATIPDELDALPISAIFRILSDQDSQPGFGSRTKAMRRVYATS